MDDCSKTQNTLSLASNFRLLADKLERLLHFFSDFPHYVSAEIVDVFSKTLLAHLGQFESLQAAWRNLAGLEPGKC